MKKNFLLFALFTFAAPSVIFANDKVDVVEPETEEPPSFSLFTDGEFYGSFRRYDGENLSTLRFPGVGLGAQHNFGKKKNWLLNFYTEYVGGYGIMLDQFSFTHTFRPEIKVTAGLFGLPIGHCNTDYGYVNYFTSGDPEGEFALISCPFTETGFALSGEFDFGLNYFVSATTGLNAEQMSPKNWASGGYQGFIPNEMNLKSPAYTLRLGYGGVEGLQCGAGVYYCLNAARNMSYRNGDDAFNNYAKTLGKNPILIWYADAEYATRWFTIRGSYLQGSLKNADVLSKYICNEGEIASQVINYMGEVGINLKGCFYPGTKGPDLIPFVHYEHYNSQYRVESNNPNTDYKTNAWSFGLNWRLINELMVKCNYTMRQTGEHSNWNRNEFNLGLAWDVTIFEK